MGRRIAYTDIAYSVIEQWLKNPIRHHDFIWSTNLPKDAKVYRVATDELVLTDPLTRREVIRIYWESSEFAECPEGSYPPAFDLIAKTQLLMLENRITTGDAT